MRRIVIVGGGYAGFYTAWKLEKKLEAERGRAGDHRPAAVHDLSAVPARGRGRIDRGAACRGLAAVAPDAHADHRGRRDDDQPRREDRDGATGRRPRLRRRLRHHRGHRRCRHPRAAHPGCRRGGDRHEARRGGRRDPRPPADGVRPRLGAGARTRAAPPAHLRVRRRRVLRRRGVRRAALAGDRAAEALPRAELLRPRVPPRRGERPHPARGDRGARAAGWWTSSASAAGTCT